MSKKGRIKKKKDKAQIAYAQKMANACYYLVYSIACRYTDKFPRVYTDNILVFYSDRLIESAINHSNESNIRENVLAACKLALEPECIPHATDVYFDFLYKGFYGLSLSSKGVLITPQNLIFVAEDKRLIETFRDLITKVKASKECQEWERNSRTYIKEMEDEWFREQYDEYFNDPLSGAWEFFYQLVINEIAKLEWLDEAFIEQLKLKLEKYKPVDEAYYQWEDELYEKYYDPSFYEGYLKRKKSGYRDIGFLYFYQ